MPNTDQYLADSEDHSDGALWNRLQREARNVERFEPLMSCYLRMTVLHPNNTSFAEAVARTVSHRLSLSCGAKPVMQEEGLCSVLHDTIMSDELEMGYTMNQAIRMDALACVHRDPACESLLEVVLFYKGYASLVCHRAARRLWNKNASSEPSYRRRFISLWLQSQASAAFGVDIHPGAEIGAAVMLDHGTGIVIGETAKIGDCCTLLHNVTLGGTGKHTGDRHPKVGANVLIGAGTSVLGNIKIGDGAKIGAGSVVLKSIPHGATAVGSPARVVGWAIESRPGSLVDLSLVNVIPLHGVTDMADQNEENQNQTRPTIEEKVIVPQNDIIHDKHENRILLVANESKSLDPNDSDNSAIVVEQNYSALREHKDNDNFVNSSQTFEEACIWRGVEAKNLPPDAVTLTKLRSILLKEGVTDDEIDEVYFGLLRNTPCLGYIPRHIFREHFSTLAQKYTKIKKCTSEDIATCLLSKL